MYDLDQNCFDTLLYDCNVPERIKLILKKKQQTTTKAQKITQHAERQYTEMSQCMAKSTQERLGPTCTPN